MRVLANTVIYRDGAHNAFTSMVAWRGRYWVALRNGASHSSHDGRVLIISSTDLAHWSDPLVAIDSAADDRDPKLVVFRDQLFVAAFSSARTYADDSGLAGWSP